MVGISIASKLAEGAQPGRHGEPPRQDPDPGRQSVRHVEWPAAAFADRLQHRFWWSGSAGTPPTSSTSGISVNARGTAMFHLYALTRIYVSEYTKIPWYPCSRSSPTPIAGRS